MRAIVSACARLSPSNCHAMLLVSDRTPCERRLKVVSSFSSGIVVVVAHLRVRSSQCNFAHHRCALASARIKTDDNCAHLLRAQFSLMRCAACSSVERTKSPTRSPASSSIHQSNSISCKSANELAFIGAPVCCCCCCRCDSSIARRDKRPRYRARHKLSRSWMVSATLKSFFEGSFALNHVIARPARTCATNAAAYSSALCATATTT